jgi:hypothetical protein
MAGMSEVSTAAPGGVAERLEPGLLAGFAVAAVAGVALVLTARESALALLIAIAVLQGVFALVWVFGTAMPGRWGGLVIAAMASAGADVTTSVWPHGRLGVLLAVAGLTVPVVFVHQLARGAARVNVVASMASVGLLALCEIGLSAALQLRHEFGPAAGQYVSSAVLAAIGGALALGFLVDVVLPVPRFDPDVPRGLLALVLSAGAGALIGHLMLHGHTADFADSRAIFAGAALGAVAGLLGVAGSFVLHTTRVPSARLAARLRPAVPALLPLFVLPPAAFLLCLAVRA